jgi:microcystin-dependent protein
MSSPFVAEIRIFACNFAPQGWALCNGQLLSISQNTALFSLVGTYYGGDGRVTFGLPNLQGAVPLNQGQSSTGTTYFLGQQSGSQYVSLIDSENPVHNHLFNANSSNGTVLASSGNELSKAFAGSLRGNTQIAMYSTANSNALMSPSAIQVVGGGQPHNNMMPYLVLNYCIALQGIYPPRS